MRSRVGLVRALLACSAASLLGVAVSVAAPAASASADTAPGTCTGGSFTSFPPSGSVVHRGQVITYRLTIEVVGDSPVLGCARDMLVSPVLEFLSARPDGAYWPDTSVGPMAEVSFDGPFDPGTTLIGLVRMRVPVDTPIGTHVWAQSGNEIEHTVGRHH